MKLMEQGQWGLRNLVGGIPEAITNWWRNNKIVALQAIAWFFTAANFGRCRMNRR
jgi:hypothetical protein